MQREGRVSAAAAFPGGSRLEYALEASNDGKTATAQLAAGRLVVRLPRAMVEQWAGSDQVSIEGAQPLDEGGQLAILVEKDFRCLAPRAGEDESDMFPHPRQDIESC